MPKHTANTARSALHPRRAGKCALIVMLLAIFILPATGCGGRSAPGAQPIPSAQETKPSSASAAPENQAGWGQALVDMQFEHISMEHGLSQSVVLDMLQDQRGFLWLGTQDGLNRYDGHTFKVYKFANPTFKAPRSKRNSSINFSRDMICPPFIFADHVL